MNRGNDWRCPQLAVFADAICEEKEFPEEFWDHVKNCRVCLYWSSYYFAAVKAMSTIDRLYHHSCPPQSHFETLLFGAVHAAIDQKLKGPNRNLNQPQIDDALKLRSAKAHINRDNDDCCELCFKYYTQLFEAMAESQKHYEAAILAGQKIEAVESAPTQVEREKIGYDPTKKPN